MTSRRKPDRITLESERGVFALWQSITVTNDMTTQNEAQLDLGDDGALEDFYRIIQPGELFVIRLNGRPRLAGRSEVRETMGDPSNGIRCRLIIRTRFADGFYCSADPTVRVEKTTIRDFVIGQYAKLGYTAADFVFNVGLDRDLMTGDKKGDPPSSGRRDLAPIKVDQAKPQPTESIRACVERHLKRFHCAHWEGPDGKIYIGQPDDEQAPTYYLRCRRGAAAVGNNCAKFTKKDDWSQVPSEMWVYGQSTGKDVAGATIKGVSKDDDLLAVFAKNKHFNRPVVLQNTEARDQLEAESMARRERSARSRDKDAWQTTTDGWTYWSDSGIQIPYAPNTVAEVNVFNAPVGRYLVMSTTLQQSLDQRVVTNLTMVAKGIWVV